MAKKNITFRIDENLIEKLNTLRGNTSQNNFLELLINSWTGEIASTSTSTSNDSQVQVQLLAQTKALEELQVQVQLLVKAQSQAQVQVPVKEEPKPKPKKEKKKPEPVLVPDEEEPLPDKPFYTLRKPVFEGRPETRHTRKTNLMVEWWLEEGDSQYFDEYQSIIPFRYKKADGTDYTPNAAEIKLLEEAYEKPVKIEETKKLENKENGETKITEEDDPDWKAF